MPRTVSSSDYRGLVGIRWMRVAGRWVALRHYRNPRFHESDTYILYLKAGALCIDK